MSRASKKRPKGAGAGADFNQDRDGDAGHLHRGSREANQVGIPILGHLPAGLDVEAASRAGVRSAEHLGPGVPLLACCSTHTDQVRAAAASGRTPRIPRVPLLTPLLERAAGPIIKRIVVNPSARMSSGEAQLIEVALGSFDLERTRRLADRFVEDGTWNVPTLLRLKSIYRCDSEEFTDNDELRYVSPEALER